jgi:hypothetical protein
MRRAALPLALAFATALAGCGSTVIQTTRADGRIYVDGQLVGVGAAQIRRFGTPGSSTVEVRTPDGKRGRQTIQRRFTTMTFLGGLFTYAIGFFIFWEYPDNVLVEVAQADKEGGWEDGSAWDRAPDGWGGAPPSADPAAAPAPVAAPVAVPVPAPSAAPAPVNDPWQAPPTQR